MGGTKTWEARHSDVMPLSRMAPAVCHVFETKHLYAQRADKSENASPKRRSGLGPQKLSHESGRVFEAGGAMGCRGITVKWATPHLECSGGVGGAVVQQHRTAARVRRDANQRPAAEH